MEDGTYVHSCEPEAHGHRVVWSGELYLFPRKETISLAMFDTMLKEMYPADGIEARMGTYGALMLCRNPLLITDV